VTDDPTWTDVTLYLARPEVATFEGLLRRPEELRLVPMNAGATLDGALYFLPEPDPDPPEWIAPLEQIAGPVPVVTTSNPGAVLLFRAEGRIFAIPFGRGHLRLRTDQLVDDFGLRIAGNRLDPEAVISFDSRAVEGTVFMTRRSASRGSELGALGLESDRDAVHSLTGRPRDSAQGSRITGRTGYLQAQAIGPDDLVQHATEALAAYGATDYQDGFGVIDQRREVDDPVRAAELTELVVNGLSTPGRGGAYLAPPEIVDWARAGGFKLSTDPRGTRRQTVSIDDYATARAGVFTLEQLQEDSITLFARDTGRPSMKWSVFKCLIAERRDTDGTFVLADGRWWRVHPDFIAEIDEVVASIPRTTVPLPEYASTDADEGAYNDRAAGLLPGTVSLDQRFLSFPGEHGTVELCDIAGPGQCLIYAKRGFRAQSLSHLFAQAVNAGETLRHLPRARRRLRELLAGPLPAVAALIDDDSMHAADWEIVIAIITDEPGRIPTGLPFFSRAHLARSVRALRRLDYKVTYAAVGVERAP
jgi:uncharacterized protein (TIGR04141 family)